MIRAERLVATLEGDFVVFLIGMRINQRWKIGKWWPVAKAMPRRVAELQRHPEMRFLHAEQWFGRATIMVQYWESLDQLLAYAKNKETAHLLAWRDFNRAVGSDGSVGIWHQTRLVSPGRYENIYYNMRAFGLGRAGQLQPATGKRESAAGRVHAGT